MLTFSTDDLRPHERFDYWCEVRARTLFGVTISLKQEERQHFSGQFSARSTGGAILSQMQASPYKVSRTASDISRASSDSLCIYQQTGGASWFNSHAGGEFAVRAGEFAISHSDLPYLTRPITAHGFDLRVLKIPMARRASLASPSLNLAPALLRDDPRLTLLISASFAALVADTTKNPEADCDLAVDHLAQLALLARGSVLAGSQDSRAALRFGFLQAARNVLARDMHHPKLAPEYVAGALGISVRQLHILFEPTGKSFSRTLMAMRLAEAYPLLRSAPTLAVTDVALACGFDSLSTFYRVFRTAYGVTPGDVRAAAGDGEDPPCLPLAPPIEQ
ncbi:MAG: helix-turn-helix transcriptional regulator [Afipia sp.]|nr:helix-turn-helix transcriptional regulator [Afipia sp.]